MPLTTGRPCVLLALLCLSVANAQHELKELETLVDYQRIVDDEMPQDSVVVAGFFLDESSEFFTDFSDLATNPGTVWEEASMEGEWPFLYSFDKEIARAAGCYEAEDGEEWDGTVCIVINKVGTLCRFFNCIHLKMQLKKTIAFF